MFDVQIGKENKESKVCNECGQLNYDGVNYCQDCGGLLTDYKYRFCEICGTKNTIKNSICDECHIIL